MIEFGKHYRRRDGEVVGPASLRHGQNPAFPWLVGGQSYTAGGKFFASGKEHAFDLVAEYVAGPRRSTGFLSGTVFEEVDRPEQLRIELGKTYRSRNGAMIGPMRAMTNTGAWRFSANNPDGVGVAWREDGSHSITPGREHPFDLVEEWIELPLVPRHSAADIATDEALVDAAVERMAREADPAEVEALRDALRAANERVADLTALISGLADTPIGDPRSEGDRQAWAIFASAALTGICATKDHFVGVETTEDRAELAAGHADALMAERAKRGLK